MADRIINIKKIEANTQSKQLIVDALQSIGVSWVDTTLPWEELAEEIEKIISFTFGTLISQEVDIDIDELTSKVKALTKITETFLRLPDVPWGTRDMISSIVEGTNRIVEMKALMAGLQAKPMIWMLENLIPNASFTGADVDIPPTGYTVTEQTNCQLTVRNITEGISLHVDALDYDNPVSFTCISPDIPLVKNWIYTVSVFIDDSSGGTSGDNLRIRKPSGGLEAGVLLTDIGVGRHNTTFKATEGGNYKVEFGVGMEAPAQLDYMDFSRLQINQGDLSSDWISS